MQNAKVTYECMERVLLTAAARAQLDAALLAEQFNRRLRGPACWYVSFLPVFIYKCWDINYADETAWVLVEPELDGKFTKWNNNAGAVLRTGCDTAEGDVGSASLRSSVSKALGAITEDDEEEEEEEVGSQEIDVGEVPQAFSHFSYVASNGKQLVCDLQGTWNGADGFMLTDPVVHYVSKRNPNKKHKNGATDKGRHGVIRFFNTHQCGPLCKRLGLPPGASLT